MWYLSSLLFSFFWLGKSFLRPPAQRYSAMRFVSTDDRPVTKTLTSDDSDIIIQTFDSALMSRTASISLWRDFPLNEIIPGKEAWKLLDVEGIDDSERVPMSDKPPSLVDYLSGRSSVQDHHLKVIQSMTSQILKKPAVMKRFESVRGTIEEAFVIAYIGLWGKQTQRSREVSINRAKGVAEIVANYEGTQLEVVLAAILSQVMGELGGPDDDVRLICDELKRKFGDSVFDLTENYVRLPKFMSRKAEYTPDQSENHIQMLVSMLSDYRALYIRLADRMHTLRVLKELPLDETDRVKIAQEALSVYVPIAARMNCQPIKGELEELAFRVIGDPERLLACKHAQMKATKALTYAEQDATALGNTDELLRSHNVTIVVKSRVKSKYQLHQKLSRKNLHCESDVRDAVGVRVIIDTPRLAGESDEAYTERSNSLCYHFVNRLTNLSRWDPPQRGFKDYIKGQKSNGYQSLHQYVTHKALGMSVEVQVRTMAMHVQAENGDAAHWHYKDLKYRPEITMTKTYNLAWRSEEQSKHASGAEFFALAKKQLNPQRVFVFLDDKSTVLNLPAGSNSLDAAFAIHSSLGLSVSMVSVNGKPVGLKRPLRNGEVITVKAAPVGSITAKFSWLDIVKTPKAQQDLKKYFKSTQNTYLVTLGLVHLMAAIGLNADKIAKRFATSKVAFPNAQRLAKSACVSCGAPHLADLLAKLSIAKSEEQLAEKIGQLLYMSSKDIEIPTKAWALSWARNQGTYGWENKGLRDDILVPILRTILPQLNIDDAEKTWTELIGAQSLVCETSSFVPVNAENSEASEAAIDDEQEFPVVPESSVPGYRLIYEKSLSSGKAIKPYALNAWTIPSPLRRMAINSYATKMSGREIQNES